MPLASSPSSSSADSDSQRFRPSAGLMAPPQEDLEGWNSEDDEDGGDPVGRRWMVNMRKCRRMSAYITTICNFNQEPYAFVPVPWLLRKLMTVDVMDESELYNRSLAIEPRG